jgi:hypothetical protein
MKPQHLKTNQDFLDETLTAKQLIDLLKKFPPNTKIYVSSDSEGNSFGTLDKQWSTMYSKGDNALALMQFSDHHEDAEIMPIMDARMVKELQEEDMARKAKQNGTTHTN